MIKLLESFDAYTTPFLPAFHKWSSSVGVTIATDQGRSGLAGDNAALFDTSLGSVLETDIVLNGIGVRTATLGQAARFLTLSDTVVIASIRTDISQFDLVVTSLGAVKLLQTTGFVLLGTICETSIGVVPIGTGGVYIEAQIVFQADGACQINVSDQYGDMNPLCRGTLLAWTDDQVPSVLRMGGGAGDAPATWLLDDIYLTDGLATTPINLNGMLIRNDSFLGNVHIQAFYPTADGANLTVGNEPWVPDVGTTAFNRINEHPPDEDLSYIHAVDSGQTTTCLFASPQPQPFGRDGCHAFAVIFGIQWDGRLRLVNAEYFIVYAVVRRIVGGTFATDVVALSAVIPIDSDTYEYYPVVFDRNPTLNLAPWDFSVFFPAGVGIPGTTEFGVRLA